MEEWSYEPAPDLQASIAERLRSFPRYPDMGIYAVRSVLHLALRGFLRSYHRLVIEGRANLPQEGSFVMICNHASHLDALCLLSSLPFRRLHRAHPAAAADYFFSSLARSFVSAAFVNGVPFDRLGRGGESLEVCRQLLARPGNVLILFPEGTRSTSGAIERFRSGIGRLVAGTPIPVVPCFLAGAAAAWPKGAAFPRPGRLRLRIGAAKTFADRSADDRADVTAICAQLRDEVLRLKVDPTAA